MGLKERLLEFISYKDMEKAVFERECGLSNDAVSKMGNNTRTSTLDKISNKFPELNISWIRTGEGEMLKENAQSLTEKNLIPFYDDVSSIGGTNEIEASLDGISAPSDYIDTGDWFKEATAAVRHYGDSMVEYPQGCILALKEVKERSLMVWGRDYVIETIEYRVTKRIQSGIDAKHIKAYSTNMGSYPDGRLIHEPLDIAWSHVRRIYAVLGYVVKKNGGNIIFSNSK